MSDVERICEMNHARVRWAEEYQDVEPFAEEIEEESDMEKYRMLRSGTAVSAGLTGIGITFLFLGLFMTHLATIIMGAIMSAAFSVCFCCFDKWAEEELDHVLFP